MPGAAHGVGGPTMLGRATASLQAPARLSELAACMAGFVSEPAPACQQNTTPEMQLMEQVLF